MPKGSKRGNSVQLKMGGSNQEKIEQAFKQIDSEFRALEKMIFTKDSLTCLLDVGKTSLQEKESSFTRKNRLHDFAISILKLYIRGSKGNEDAANNNKAIMLAVKYVDFKKNNFDAILKPLLSQEFDITYTDCDDIRLGEQLIFLLNKVDSDVFRRKVSEAFVSNLESFEKEEALIGDYLRSLVIRFFQNAVEKRMIDLCERLMPFGLGVVLPLVAVAEFLAYMKKETAEEGDASNEAKKKQLDACVQWLEDHKKISPFVANVFHHVLCDKQFDFTLAILPQKAELIMALHFAVILGAEDVASDLLKMPEVLKDVNEACFLTEDEAEQARLEETYKGIDDNNVRTFMCRATALMRAIIFEGHIGIVRILWSAVNPKLDTQARTDLLVLAIKYSSPEMVRFLLEKGAHCKAGFISEIIAESPLAKLQALNKIVPLPLNRENDQGMNVLDVLMNRITASIHEISGVGLKVGVINLDVSVSEKIKLLLSFKAVCNKEFYGILLKWVLLDVKIHDCVIDVLRMILGPTTDDLTFLKEFLTEEDEAGMQLLLTEDVEKNLAVFEVILLLRDKIKEGKLLEVDRLEKIYLLCTNTITSAVMNSRKLKQIEGEHAVEKVEMEREIAALGRQQLKAQRESDKSNVTIQKVNARNNTLEGKLRASETNNARLLEERTAAIQEASRLKDDWEEVKRLAKGEKDEMKRQIATLEGQLLKAQLESDKSQLTAIKDQAKINKLVGQQRALKKDNVRLSGKLAEKINELRRLNNVLAEAKRLLTEKGKISKKTIGQLVFGSHIDGSTEVIKDLCEALGYNENMVFSGQKKVADTDGGDKDRSASSRDSGSSGTYQSANSGRSSADLMDDTAVSAASSPNDCAGGSRDSCNSHKKPTDDGSASRPARQAQSNGQKGPGSAGKSGIFTGKGSPGRPLGPALGKSKQASGRRPVAP